MLDVKLLREPPEVVRKNLERRNLSLKVPLVEEALRVDRDWRNLKTRVEELRHRQNQLTVEVANLKKQGKSIAGKLKEIEDIPENRRNAPDVQARLDKALAQIDGLDNGRAENQEALEAVHIVLFVNQPKLLSDTYSRYLKRRIRAAWPFHGIPVLFSCRARSEKA